MYKSRVHSCLANRATSYVVATTMQGVKEIWLVYDIDDEEDEKNIIYGIVYCPFCGEKLA